MFEKYIVPLYLTSNLKRVIGKTRFQKLICLIQREADKGGIGGLDFEYELYHHGPFSSELATTIDSLVEKGYLSEMTEETPSGNTVFVYELTTSGRSLLRKAKKKKVVGEALLSVVDEVSREFGYLKLPQLVEEAYKVV